MTTPLPSGPPADVAAEIEKWYVPLKKQWNDTHSINGTLDISGDTVADLFQAVSTLLRLLKQRPGREEIAQAICRYYGTDPLKEAVYSVATHHGRAPNEGGSSPTAQTQVAVIAWRKYEGLAVAVLALMEGR